MVLENASSGTTWLALSKKFWIYGQLLKTPRKFIHDGLGELELQAKLLSANANSGDGGGTSVYRKIVVRNRMSDIARLP